MSSTSEDVAVAGTSTARWITGIVLAVLAGPLPWAVWVWPFSNEIGYLPSWGYSAFFSTVAGLGLVIGVVAVRGYPTLMVLAATSWISVMVTVYLWWSVDETGLFMLGIIMLTLPVGAGAVVVLGAGWALGGVWDRRSRVGG